MEILQKWIEADQELDAAHAKQVQAKHERSILVAEQTAENAKAVNQGTSGIQSLSYPDAQQTILSVFKSVLSMQNMGCHSVAEQLMAAVATDEEVKKISQVMAQTVRKLEGGSNIPEPRIEMPKPACEVVVLEADLPSCIPGYSSMDIEGQEAIKRSLSNAATEKRRLANKCKQEEDVSGFGFVSSHYLCSSRFPELAKRRIQVLFALQRSCLVPNTMHLAYGLRICPTGAKWSWNHFSHKLVNADKCLVNVSEKIPSSTLHRSVRTSTALIWIEVHCLFPLNVTKTLHTLNNFVIISLSLFQEGEQGGSGHHVLSNVHFVGMEGKERSNPFCHRPTRGGRKHTGRKRKLEISKGVVNILQCNVTTWSEHARHYILTSDFDAALISQTHLGKERLLSAVTEAKKSGWAGTGSAATNTVNNGTSASAGVLALVPKRWFQAPVNLQ